MPEVEFQNADAREAVRWLFRKGGFGGTIAPDVQGVVTLSLKNWPWQDALQAVLRQVDATYRFDHGFVDVVHREEPGLSAAKAPGLPVGDRQAIEAGYRWLRYKVATGQGKEVASRLSGVTVYDYARNPKASGRAAYREIVDTERANPAFSILAYGEALGRETTPNADWVAVDVVYAPSPGGRTTRYRDLWRREGQEAWTLASRKDATMRFEDADVRDVVRAVWGTVDAGYTIDPQVRGRITYDFTDVPFETALQQIASQVKATYRIDGGIYRIVPRA